MSCVVIGSTDQAKGLGLPTTTVVHPPEELSKAARYMTRLVVIGPRLLNDRDFELANRVPTLFVLTNATDLLHLEMYIHMGRLFLTPYDGVVLTGSLASSLVVANWANLYSRSNRDLRSFIKQIPSKPFYSVPAGFEKLPKSLLVDLGARMHKLQLNQYEPVLALSKNCRSLIGVLCNMANVVIEDLNHLAADGICVEPTLVADQLVTHPDAQFLICPAIVSSEMPIGLINQMITTATFKPVNLMNVAPGFRLPGNQFLTSLIYDIG